MATPNETAHHPNNTRNTVRTLEDKLERMHRSLIKTRDDFNHQIDELFFLNMAIPAIFSDGMPADRYISGMFFNMENLALRMEKTLNGLDDIASTKNNIQGVTS